ncbi:MAG: 2-oxo acid dehydrogenase subunit E2, partial [Polyangiaceae bacterium]|nr:2-oxo acid dehydrogenase subunit E2 [Polyangiaceae bacterium]
MAKILDMPKLSPTMEEGVLSVWHKKEGDTIKVDDLLAEVETDKATMEYRSFDNGTILKLLVPAPSQVKLGQPVAILGTPGEDISALLSSATAGVAAPAKASTETAQTTPAAQAAPAAPAPQAAATANASPASPAALATAPISGTGRVSAGSLLDRTEREGVAYVSTERGRVFASPYVRQQARERGLDLAGIAGSGPGGRVIAEDLEKLPAAPRGGALATAPGSAIATSPTAALGLKEPTQKPLSPMRKTIAKRLTESKQTVPHFYLTIDIDATKLAQFREDINSELLQAANGDAEKAGKISINDLLIKACAVALTKVPECNAQFTSEAILLHQRVDISVAVAVPDGLVTPVLRDSDKKSVVQIAKEVRELASRARAKKLKPEEMMYGTFSISNLGMFGIDEFSAVINPPEGAILAVGRVR